MGREAPGLFNFRAVFRAARLFGAAKDTDEPAAATKTRIGCATRRPPAAVTAGSRPGHQGSTSYLLAPVLLATVP